jgi:hypothetical protein
MSDSITRIIGHTHDILSGKIHMFQYLRFKYLVRSGLKLESPSIILTPCDEFKMVANLKVLLGTVTFNGKPRDLGVYRISYGIPSWEMSHARVKSGCFILQFVGSLSMPCSQHVFNFAWFSTRKSILSQLRRDVGWPSVILSEHSQVMEIDTLLCISKLQSGS